MPSNIIASFVHKSGKPFGEVEHMWNSLKRELTSRGMSGDDLYRMIVGIMKKNLKIQENNMKLMDKYLVSEAKELEFEKDEIKVLDKAFKRDYSGELDSNTSYSVADDGSSGSNERLFVDINKTDKGYEVDSTLSDEDGDESQGSLKFKEKNLKKVIKKIFMRI